MLKLEPGPSDVPNDGHAARPRNAPGRKATRLSRWRSPVYDGTEAGYALLEVMVAFMIAALALGVLFQSGVSNLRSIQTSSRYEEALARARSRLAIADHGAPLVAGELEGDDGGGYRWRVLVSQVAATSVRPLGMLSPNHPARVPLALYAVSVRVSWADRGSEAGSRHEVRLDSHHVQSVLP